MLAAKVSMGLWIFTTFFGSSIGFDIQTRIRRHNMCNRHMGYDVVTHSVPG
jgi:hypothetical protein